jgi:short-subunit dehydrogenase
MRLQRLSDQVIVITGASSGIGLTTARMAAKAGAKVVMTARDEETLRSEAEHIRSEGGEATYLAGDVADPEALVRVARHAVLTYGRIDTWVNNAGIAVYGLAEEVSLADMRRVLDVTFWGVVHGCLAAIPRLKENGGVLINVGSVESEMSTPYHSSYSAAKHAVKGFTNTLRMELDKEGAPVAVTLIKPAGIDTPFFEHAKNYMEGNPKPPPPVYAPEIVARTILRCAEKPVRDIIVGGSGRVMVGLTNALPRTSDSLYEATMFGAQQTSRPTRHDRAGALYTTGPFNGRERGQYGGMVRTHSYSTALALRPTQSAIGIALLGAALVGAASLMNGRVSLGAPSFARRRTLGAGPRVAPANERILPRQTTRTRYVDYDPALPESPPRYPEA